MSKMQKTAECILGSIIGILAANYLLLRVISDLLPAALGLFIKAVPVLFVLLNLYPALPLRRPGSYRLGVCNRGCNLLIIFVVTTLVNIPLTIILICWWIPGVEALMPGAVVYWLMHCLVVLGAEIILFWNGILRVYLSSGQLGIRLRVIGIICGFIPIANIIVLFWIIQTASQEVRFENQKLLTDQARCHELLCATRYPILMVHGVFFRDFRYFNYWGRIPQALEANGAKIYYGNHQSAAPVTASGQEIASRILAIVRETGCEKVNVIAHSKGGLDTRAALRIPGTRGISHGDMIDLNRENVPGFDVREFYVQLVHGLKKRGF